MLVASVVTSIALLQHDGAQQLSPGVPWATGMFALAIAA
jgi:hypothetical protein